MSSAILTSAAADRPGGRNLIGIKNKAVDILVEKLILRPRVTGLSRPAGRSTVCCAPIIMSCRNGTHRMSVWLLARHCPWRAPAQIWVGLSIRLVSHRAA